MALSMLRPHKADNLHDLAFKVKMVNVFGQVGAGTPEDRDRVVGELRAAMRKTEQPKAGVVLTPVVVQKLKDHGEQ
jgi:hypothetical protein